MPLNKPPWKTPFRSMKLVAVFLIGILLVGVYIQTDHLSLNPAQIGLNPRVEKTAGHKTQNSNLSKTFNQIPKFRVIEFKDLMLTSEKTKDILQHSNSKPLIIFFWATWCKNCKAQVKELMALKERHPKNLQVLAVNIENASYKKINNYWTSLNSSIPLLIDKDQKFLELFKIEILPTVALMGPKGQYLMKLDGPIDWSNQELNSKLNAYLETYKN